MAETELTFGTEAGLLVRLRWDSAIAAGSPAEATRGRLAPSVAGRLAWGTSAGEGTTGFHWTWVDLLEHLAQHWPYLRWEEQDPIGLGQSPEELRTFAEERWRGVPTEIAATEERALWEFEDSHNLANAVPGASLAALWVLRQGAECVVAARGERVVRPLGEVIDALTQLGHAIAQRIEGLADPRAHAARSAWEARSQVPLGRAAAIASGLPESTLMELAGRQTLEAALEIEADRPESELLAVARMSSPAVPAEQLRPIIAAVRKQGPRRTPGLDALVRDAAGAAGAGRPHAQGYAVARWLRAEVLRVPETRKADPDGVLADWKVPVRELALAPESFDAVCAWGPRHGPVIIVNASGRRAHASAGRRSTLAHEICHLLLDRAGALPLGEVLGGRAPKATEQRANAFAAEFLAPRAVVAEAFGHGGDPTRLLDSLARRFGCSREVVAWQARNAGRQLDASTLDALRPFVSAPDRFGW